MFNVENICILVKTGIKTDYKIYLKAKHWKWEQFYTFFYWQEFLKYCVFSFTFEIIICLITF